MKPLIVIPVHGAADLGALCLASLEAIQATGRGATVYTIPSRDDKKLVRHGIKLDYAKVLAAERAIDTVICLDQDVVVWPGWWEWIERTLVDPLIGACGAPRMEPEPGLHPSMLAMRRELFIHTPSFDFDSVSGRDVGVSACAWIEQQGLYLAAAPMSRGSINDWWYFGVPNDLWWHLGSSTDSEWPGVLRQSYRLVRSAFGSRPHQKAVDRVRRRRQFIRAASARLHG